GDLTEFGKVAHQATIENQEQTPLNRQLDQLAKVIGGVGFVLSMVTFVAMTIKDFVDTPVPLGQLGLLCAAILGSFVMLGKVWIPIIFDIRELLGSKKEPSERFTSSKMPYWILLGLLTFAAFALIGIPFGVHFWDADHWVSFDIADRVLQHFMVAVTLIVVAVPEGLPMSVTLSLALSMRKMLKNNNLVRKMHASETMGATTVICTDKTGTLTKNQMNVDSMDLYTQDTSLLYKALAVNTTAHLNPEGAPLGNPTEGALLLWLKSRGEDYMELRSDILDQIPFSSKLKMMQTTAQFQGREYTFVKGAPEYVIAKCVGVDTEAIGKKLSEYQNRAMRTLAMAVEVDGVCTLQAIAAIADPIREDVPAAVTHCTEAGIAIKMVTGDTPATAREIARQIGLWGQQDTPVNEITGPEWEALSDDEAYERAVHLKIMARARPMDKQRLVKMLQKRGEVVAVTGDGTNDAPALNFANVGLSMGTGTSVAKEASDITLLDDSFASIANAVMWGRSVYINIQRFVLFQLTINVAALSLVFFGSLLGFELPLTVTQMLWVNLIMDTFAAGALASLPADESVMKDKPRGIGSFIISPFMGRSILGVGIFFVVLLIGLLYLFTDQSGEISLYNQSLFFTIFVMLQFWNMFNAKAYRSGASAFKGLLKSPAFLTVSLVIIIGQILIVSFGGEAFRVVPLTFTDWLIVIGGTSLVLWVGEISRLCTKRAKK
ncbi:MAG: cation-translocating P-type ATPase, partial [Rikenellaceae bacterium]